MNLIVKKTTSLQGQATPPGSKSQSIRGIILASLCKGKSTLSNMLDSDDTRDAKIAFHLLGADFSTDQQTLNIKSQGLPFSPQASEIHTGNSGITTHFIMPLLGLRQHPAQPIILNCSEQMRARPIAALVDALRNLGLQIDYLQNPNTLPIRVTGALAGGKTEVSGVTSQYLSALLFALPCANGNSEVRVKNLQERPYVEMTLAWLRNQQIKFEHELLADTDIFHIAGQQQYQPFHSQIPGDFSSASYLIAAACMLPGEVTLNGLNMQDVQGDKQLVTLLQQMGADITIQPHALQIRGGKKLSGIKIDANHIPDLLPTLAVIGTYAQGQTEIYHVAHARIKETDRIQSMSDGLTRMGANIMEKEDGLIIHHSSLHHATVDGYGDHRTVMALSLAGMLADGNTVISGCEAMNKTFPHYVQLMQSLGAQMEVSDASA